MTCEELRPEYGAYALGAADDPERREISEHLGSHCPACEAGVRSAMVTVAVMARAVTPAEPSKRLRKRIVAMVSSAPERAGISFWLPWAVSAALALVLLSVAIPGRFQKNNAAATTNPARFNEVMSILNDPVTKDVAFGVPAASGRFFVSPTRGVVFIASHMPKLDAGRTFEMWVIPASGKPVPAGTFQALLDSTALYVRPGPVDGAAALAVSVEPEGGSLQPTTTPILVTKL